jgi:hypothetical protein
VLFNGSPATSVSCPTSTECTAVAPPPTVLPSAPVTVSVLGQTANVGSFTYLPNPAPKAPACGYSAEASNVFVGCEGGNPGDSVFVFQQAADGTWHYLERGLDAGVNVSEPGGSSLTMLGCSANASWGLYTDAQGLPADLAPVGPGDVGCDPTATTVQIPTCVPFTCAELCGTVSNGCGGTLHCGVCSPPPPTKCPPPTYKCGNKCC